MSLLIFVFSFVFFGGVGIFALIMLIILQVSAVAGRLQPSGISSPPPPSPALTALAPSMLRGAQEGGRDDQQSCLVSAFVILVLRSDPIPPNQTIERVYVLVGAVRRRLPSPGNVPLENKLNVTRLFSPIEALSTTD